jgi:hypothetical protein
MIKQYLSYGEKKEKCQSVEHAKMNKNRLSTKMERKNPQKDEQRDDQHIYQKLENTPSKHNPDNMLNYPCCTA